MEYEFFSYGQTVEVERADSLFYELDNNINKPVGMFYYAN